MKKKIMTIAILGIIACEIADMIELWYKKNALRNAKEEIDILEHQLSVMKKKKKKAENQRRHFRR